MCVLVCPQFGCKSNTTDRLVVSLGAVSAASAVAIAVATSLEANEAIDSAAAARIINYSQSVGVATSKAIAELSVEETDRQRILNISAIFTAVPPVVISGDDAKAVAVVQAIQVAIQTLLVQLSEASKSTSVRGTRTIASLTSAQMAQIVRADTQVRQTAQAALTWNPVHPLLAAGYMK